uniref:Uncharacterized protein n=1 Tax=Anguilla anguilla TaxID=7936 RepID=A0A0E9TUV0_ANGAN
MSHLDRPILSRVLPINYSFVNVPGAIFYTRKLADV